MRRVTSYPIESGLKKVLGPRFWRYKQVQATPGSKTPKKQIAQFTYWVNSVLFQSDRKFSNKQKKHFKKLKAKSGQFHLSESIHRYHEHDRRKKSNSTIVQNVEKNLIYDLNTLATELNEYTKKLQRLTPLNFKKQYSTWLPV